MSIVKKPAGKSAEIDKFISSAPDGDGPKAGKEDGVQITLRLSHEQLARITAMAKRQGIPRASYIKRCVFVALEQDEQA